MSNRDTLIYVTIGLSVWLNGAVTFRLAGRVLFENGPAIIIISAVVIALLVCLIFQRTMIWRKANAAQAVTVAVIMALPGLFGEVVRQLLFSWTTGLDVGTAPAFAATMFFGNAVLLTYAVVQARRAA